LVSQNTGQQKELSKSLLITPLNNRASVVTFSITIQLSTRTWNLMTLSCTLQSKNTGN
jgi:hypothetical protein